MYPPRQQSNTMMRMTPSPQQQPGSGGMMGKMQQNRGGGGGIFGSMGRSMSGMFGGGGGQGRPFQQAQQTYQQQKPPWMMGGGMSQGQPMGSTPINQRPTGIGPSMGGGMFPPMIHRPNQGPPGGYDRGPGGMTGRPQGPLSGQPYDSSREYMPRQAPPGQATTMDMIRNPNYQGGVGPSPGGFGQMMQNIMQQQPYDPNYQEPAMVNNGWGKMIPREEAEAFRRGGGVS